MSNEVLGIGISICILGLSLIFMLVLCIKLAEDMKEWTV